MLAPPLRGGLLVCGTTSDAGKSFVVAGLCRLLARRGVSVAPFKAQNMALNAAVTADGGEIGHAQWVQAVAAGVTPEVAMNPVLLKPTGDRASQVVVMGRATGVQTAAEYHRSKRALLPVVLDALADLRSRFDVVICEGAGSPAEINLLAGDIVNLPLARAAGLPAIVVGDIDRGGVFASLYGTVALLPDDLRACVRGFVVNRLRGDPALLGDACADLEARCGVPTLGVVPMADPAVVADIDNEDSLALDRPPFDAGVTDPTGAAVPGPAGPTDGATTTAGAAANLTDASGASLTDAHAGVTADPEAGLTDAEPASLTAAAAGTTAPRSGAIGRTSATPSLRSDAGGGHAAAEVDTLDVASIRWPRVSNAGDLDPLHLERGVRVRWVRSVAELGRPDLVVLPGSKNTRGDLDWFVTSGLAAAVERSDAALVAVCAGLQMAGGPIDDPDGIEGAPGSDKGLGWLPVSTDFRGDKVLDRPSGRAVSGPGTAGPGTLGPGTTGSGTTGSRSVAETHVAGYRIHHGRVTAGQGAIEWLVTDDGAAVGWWDGDRVAGTTLHGLFESDGFRSGVLAWAAARAGKRWTPGGFDFAATRLARLDRIADLLEAHLDLDRVASLIAESAP